MSMLKKYNEYKKMFENWITFSVLLSVFICCHASLATPLNGNAEGQVNPLKVNQASYQGGSNGGNQWIPSYGPVMNRYHGPGADFAVRVHRSTYPPDLAGKGDIDNGELDWAEVERIMSLLNSPLESNERRKRRPF